MRERDFFLIMLLPTSFYTIINGEVTLSLLNPQLVNCVGLAVQRQLFEKEAMTTMQNVVDQTFSMIL